MRSLGRWTALLAALAMVGAFASVAAADRAPTKREKAAIKRVGLRPCEAFGQDCRFLRARVSTANARYAWATVVGEGFSGVLVKRPSRRSLRFRVIGTQGGGIGECSYWRKRAPRAVLRDLRISGLVDESGTVRNCGKR